MIKLNLVVVLVSLFCGLSSFAAQETLCARLVLSQEGVESLCLENLGQPEEKLFLIINKQSLVMHLDSTKTLDAHSNFSDTYLTQESLYSPEAPLHEIAVHAKITKFFKNDELVAFDGGISGSKDGKPGTSDVDGGSFMPLSEYCKNNPSFQLCPK